MQIYFDEKNKTYYLETCVAFCTKCKEEIEEYSFLHRNAKQKEYQIFCHNCVEHAQKLSSIVGVYETIFALIIDEAPETATPLINNKLDVSDSKGRTVFEAAIDNSCFSGDTSSVQIVDNTKLACKESLEGARIGVKPKSDELVFDVKKELEAWKEAEPVIEYKEKPRLK